MTTKTIQIICTSPGMRRNGMRHPASAFYPADRWSEEQLAAFDRDPNFFVRPVDEAENVQTETDFEMRVAAEVEKRVAEKENALALVFEGAVARKAEEKIEELQVKIGDLEAQLKAKDTPEPASTAKPTAVKK
jgi:hypothetical protein